MTDDVTVNGFTQRSATGTTTFGGSVEVNTFLGISLTGTNFVFSNPVTTTNGGGITVNNSGTLEISSPVNSAAIFSQSGAGAVTFSSSITAGQNVSFVGIVDLTGTPSIDTSASNKNITFSGEVEGPGDLALTAGSGDITFSSIAGGSTRLGDVVITSVDEVSLQSISAASLNVVSALESVALNGTVNTNGTGNSIVLVCKNFYNNAALVTTNGGSVIITNSGIISGMSDNDSSISGSYTQNGTGQVELIGSITTISGNISYSSPVTLVAAAELTSGNNIVFSDVVDGGYDLSVSATGDITFNGALGSTIPLSDLSISSAVNVISDAITASSITQSLGSGTSTFNGSLITSGSSGINLVGTNIIRGSDWTANNSGSIIVNNSGTFTSTAAGSINAIGSFNQSGSGSVLLGGVVRSDDEGINFSGPIVLAADTNLNAGSTSAAVTFNSTLNGSYGFVVNCRNNGDLLFSDNVGAITPLGDILVAAAGAVTFPASLNATSFDVVLATGTATLYIVSGNGGNMTSLEINAGDILFGGVIDADLTNFVSDNAILNISVPVSINSIGTNSFNALDGNVGSLDSPIEVNTSGQIIAGSTFLANFNGTSGDDTVNSLESNPPCLIIFNGVIIYDCRTPVASATAFVAPGFDSSSFNLANDFFFKTFFLGKGRYVEEEVRKLIYYKKTANIVTDIKKHKTANQNSHLKANMVFKLPFSSRDLFESPEIENKRKLLSFVFRILKLNEKTFLINSYEPFTAMMNYKLCSMNRRT